jgi:hypothetical protein
MFIIYYWASHPCGGWYLEAAHYWTENGRGKYAPRR